MILFLGIQQHESSRYAIADCITAIDEQLEDLVREFNEHSEPQKRLLLEIKHLALERSQLNRQFTDLSPERYGHQILVLGTFARAEVSTIAQTPGNDAIPFRVTSETPAYEPI